MKFAHPWRDILSSESNGTSSEGSEANDSVINIERIDSGSADLDLHDQESPKSTVLER